MHLDHIPQISLTDEERAKYDQSARIFLLETMAERSKFNPEHVDPKQWEYVRRRKSMSVYHSVNGTPDPAVLLMLGTGLIDGSIEDVLSGLYCDITEDLRTAKVLLGYPLAGGAVMNVSERRSVKDPFRFAGIKWFAAKSVWGLMRDRDVLTYERMGLTVDTDGEQWGYHTLQSIRRPEWPMEAIPGMQRQHTATCYLYRPRRDINKTEIFLWGSIYKFGKYPDKVIYYGVATTWLNVVHSPTSGHAKKFSALMERAESHGWTATRDCSRLKDIFALDAKRKKPLRRLFCVLCIKSVIGSAHWSVDDHIEVSGLESEPEFLFLSISSYTGTESMSNCSRASIIDPSADRFLFCVVWSPIPVITWVLPFIGHLGIADSKGIIHDFEGTNAIGRDNFLFGIPTRYVQLDVAPDQVTRWDEAVAKGSTTYSTRTYNFLYEFQLAIRGAEFIEDSETR
ncbi:hypothetical protein JG687_00009087 [Phytophthora cactorum]|uniref:Uncharacterized protein n=1 Tax=Phytophthora cactorum TaxID=29920 RepID=A0A8T1UC71_9STRA|nr:hypothetical protein JG687_00009087 [Phytophthora cactorum]